MEKINKKSIIKKIKDEVYAKGVSVILFPEHNDYADAELNEDFIKNTIEHYSHLIDL